MTIEHVAFQVRTPGDVADWYCRHVGFSVQRAIDTPAPVRFIADEGGRMMLELYNNPSLDVPDYASMSPVLLHLAFACEDVQGTAERLITAGATLLAGPETLPSGDEMAILRDPWGLPVQLINRAEPIRKV